jgi:hypothetical protein
MSESRATASPPSATAASPRRPGAARVLTSWYAAKDDLLRGALRRFVDAEAARLRPRLLLRLVRGITARRR